MNLLSFINTQVSDKAGVAPGTMVYIGEPQKREPEVSVFHYDAENIQEVQQASLDNLAPSPNPSDVTWINIDGVHDLGLVKKIGTQFSLHPLILEDIVNTTQRPKVEEYENGLYLVLKMISYDEEAHELDLEQVSIFLGRGFVLTFQEKSADVFGPIRNRLREGAGRIRKRKEDYLFYALIDVIVSNYYLVLEEIEERIEQIDETIHAKNSPQTVREIQEWKRSLILLRKSILPLREVLVHLAKPQDPPLLDKKTLLFFRDLQGQLIQVLELAETYRDVLSNLYDLHFAMNGQKLNEIMKVLTVVSTIFIPLTFVAGIYGMNFQYMPELSWQYGYFAVWGLILTILGGMLYFFRKHNWL